MVYIIVDKTHTKGEIVDKGMKALKQFATGLLTGGILCAVGVSWMMSDTKTRKRVARKAGRVIDGVADIFY